MKIKTKYEIGDEVYHYSDVNGIKKLKINGIYVSVDNGESTYINYSVLLGNKFSEEELFKNRGELKKHIIDKIKNEHDEKVKKFNIENDN